jgi:hypothetical protein
MVDGSCSRDPGDPGTGGEMMGDPILADEVTICRADAVLTRRLLDGVIVLASGAREPVRVSAPGDVLWSLLDEACTVEDLVAVWSTIYDVSLDTARTEITPVLRAWVEAGAVTVSSAP